jgi:hypothetical protein
VNYKHYRELKREEDRRDYHRAYWHKRKERELNNSTETQQTQPKQKQKQKQETQCVVSGGLFSEFWSVWPKSSRKGRKAECEKLWKAKSFEAEASAIITHVKAMSKSEDWTKDGGQYIPAPIVYLRGRRWDGAEVSAVAAQIQGAGQVESTKALLAKMDEQAKAATPMPEHLRELLQRNKRAA